MIMQKIGYATLLVCLTTGLTACQFFEKVEKDVSATLPQIENKEIKILVIKDSGLKQCQASTTNILRNAQLALAAQHVDADQGQCVRLLGMSYMAVCGGTSGLFTAFNIPQSQLEQAKKAGFDLPPVSTESTSCPNH